MNTFARVIKADWVVVLICSLSTLAGAQQASDFTLWQGLFSAGGGTMEGGMFRVVGSAGPATAGQAADGTSLLTSGLLAYPVCDEFKLELYAGWNLVSVPFEPEDSAIDAVFGDAVREPVVEWAATHYSKAAVMTCLKGYWVYAASDADVCVEGFPLQDSSCDLTAGWNLVGITGKAPCQNLQLPLVEYPQGAVLYPVYDWRTNIREYGMPVSLKPGTGCWVFAGEDSSVWLGSD